MPRTFAEAVATREDNDLVTSCQRLARPSLQGVVDRSAIAQKVLAQSVCNGDEPMLSKKLAGGRPFDLDDLDNLPRGILVEWLKVFGARIGVRVTDLDPGEVTERLLELIAEVARQADLARVTTKAIKAQLK